MNMFSRPVSRWGEKAVGFASVALAIMTESAPTIARIQRASSKTYTVAILDNHNVAPEALDKSMISLRRTSVLARAHVARAAVDRKAVDACVEDALQCSTRANLSSCVGRRQIFAEGDAWGSQLERENSSSAFSVFVSSSRAPGFFSRGRGG